MPHTGSLTAPAGLRLVRAVGMVRDAVMVPDMLSPLSEPDTPGGYA